MPPPRSDTLPRSLHKGPVDVDVLAEQIGSVQLVSGGQSLLVSLVLDKSISL